MEKERSHGIAPTKRRKLFHRDMCIICQESTEAQVHAATASGVTTFAAAALRRGDVVYDRVQDIICDAGKSVDELCWHPLCYRSYTSEHNLRNALPKQTNTDECADSSDGKRIKTRMNTGKVDWDVCVICQRKTYKKSLLTSTIVSDDMCARIHSAAVLKNDAQLLLRIQNVNLITKCAKYHKGCLCKYARHSSADRETVDNHSNETANKRAYNEAFQHTVESIVEPMLSNNTACEMTQLTKTFKEDLRDKGVKSYGSYTTQRLKRRLEKRYQDKIAFAKPSQRSKCEVVYGTHSRGDLIQASVDGSAIVCKDELLNSDVHVDMVDTVMANGDSVSNKSPKNDHASATASKTTTIYHAAQIIKNDISSSHGICIQPLDSADLTAEKSRSIIPDSLYNILRLIICTDEDSVLDVDRRRMLSIGQDIMNAASHARIKTPKHVGLAMTIKHVTGSKDVLHLLNRMGHCSCYQDVQQVDTSLAKEVLAKSSGNAAVLPSNIIPAGNFVQAAADNIDFSEKTVDGMQTTHATSIVLHQEKPSASEPPKQPPLCSHSKRERSLGKRTVKEGSLKYTAAAKRPIVTNFVNKIDNNLDDTVHENNMLDREWTLLRMLPPSLPLNNTTIEETVGTPEPQTIPGWSGFNALISTEVKHTTTVGYCPILNTAPTDNETVYNILKILQEMMKLISQKESVITFDLAIYSRAKEIQWRRPDEFADTTIRLGGFHIALNYLAVIGKLFADSGLCELLTESAVYGPNTADQLLAGRSYDRGIRAHKLVYESLMRLLWRGFLKYVDEQDVDINEDDVRAYLRDCRDCITNAIVGIDSTFPYTTPEMTTLHRLFNTYITSSIATSQTFQFWMMYLTMVEILLSYIRAEREGKWVDHLASVRRMIPYFMALDRQNYGRWLPVYLAEMRMLPETSPKVHEELLARHSVARSTQKFAQVWSDQALEQTLNKDTKRNGGGLIGMTKKEEAMDRWCLSYHERASIVGATKTMFDVSITKTKHHDLAKATIERDETAVRDVVKVFKSGLASNPFDTSDHDQDDSTPLPLSNIITGTTLPQPISKRILEIKGIGEEKLKEFVEKRLDTNEVFFWEPLKNTKITTFSTASKHKSKHTSSENKIPISDRNLLGRLLVLSNTRTIQKRTVLEHELTSVPMALAHADGSLRKTNKCDLLSELERKTEAVASLPDPTDDQHTTAVMIDAMALIQATKTNGLKTFGEFADRCGGAILANLSVKQCARVDVVFDRYDTEQSIKSFERTRRGHLKSSLEVKIKGGMTPLPKRWNDYLSNSRNKTNLIQFLSEQWKRTFGYALDQQNEIRIAGGENNPEICVKITSDEVIECPELRSNHEEADTRLLLHANDASHHHEELVIRSPDTDVAVLCIHFRSSIQCAHLWFQTGTKDKKRYIPIHAIASIIGNDMCAALPGLHALSGCDTTSSIRGMSKKKALSTVEKIGIDTIVQLGDVIPPTSETLSKCESFVCALYHTQGHMYTSCDELRYSYFCHKTQDSEKLPPTTDSISLHILRSNYQTRIWKQSLTAMMDVDNPDGNGWVLDDGKITPQLMVKDPAPRGMIEMTVCSCEKSQCQARCSCRVNGLPCTDACKCSLGNYCKNPTQLTNDDDDGDDDETDDRGFGGSM